MTPLHGAPDSRARVAYILAASHSGSTLLAMLLGSHADICTVGELKATSLGDPERYRCSCGAPIRRCRFWTDVARMMAERGHPFDIASAGTDLNAGASRYVASLLRPLHRGSTLEQIRDFALGLAPSWRSRVRRFHAVNEAFIRTLLARTGKSVVVDSSKSPVYDSKYLILGFT